MNAPLPSIISLENKLHIAAQKKNDPFYNGFHIDVKDSSFISSLNNLDEPLKIINKDRLELHMMLDYPENHFNSVELKENDIFTFHIECKSNLSIENLLKKIATKKWIRSIALRPETPIESIFSIRAPFERILLTSKSSKSLMNCKNKNKLNALTKFKQSHDLSFTIAIEVEDQKNLNYQLLEFGANEIIHSNVIISNY
jgi:pentose-5-phosphate-3-epimerase